LIKWLFTLFTIFIYLFIYLLLRQITARHTDIQTAIYSIQLLGLYRNLRKNTHRNDVKQITSPQTWELSSKSVLWLSCSTVSAIAHYTNYTQRWKL